MTRRLRLFRACAPAERRWAPVREPWIGMRPDTSFLCRILRPDGLLEVYLNRPDFGGFKPCDESHKSAHTR